MKQSLYTALAIILLFSLPSGAEVASQSTLSPAKAATAKQYPRIVLYSVSWCPRCRETKEYLTKNDIPFINYDVEVDTQAMQDLTIKYNSTGVPVIIFGKGNDEIIMKGFTPELFKEKLQQARSK